MPRSLQSLKKVIRSVKNTKKITRTMQLISSSKLQRALKTLGKAYDYADQIRQTVAVIDQTEIEKNKFLNTQTQGQKVIYILFTSDRGLCGSFNNKVILSAQKDLNPAIENSVICIGKKGAIFAKRNSIKLLGLYDSNTKQVNAEYLAPVMDSVVNAFRDGSIDTVKICYTKYINAFKQENIVETILPFNIKSSEDNVASALFKYEPDPNELIDWLIPKMIEMKLYAAWVESLASEHSSRIQAMKNATDSAGEIVDSLTLEMNKSRQAQITQEIAQIVNGMNAIV